jgi:hypothetical protein
MCPDPEIVIVCVPNDWADSWGDDCEAYAANPDWCGYEESSDNCCVCGAGQETKSCEPAPSARRFYTMAAVGSDIFVFGGETDQGEEARCACWPPSGDMSDIAPAIAPRTAAVCARPHGLERGCCAWRHPGLVVTHGAAQQLYAGTVCRSGHTLMSTCTMWHREPRGAPGGCCVEDRIGM